MLTDKVANKLLCGDIKAFWAKRNIQFGITKCVSTCFAFNKILIYIAKGFVSYFESNFYDSASNEVLYI